MSIMALQLSVVGITIDLVGGRESRRAASFTLFPGFELSRMTTKCRDWNWTGNKGELAAIGYHGYTTFHSAVATLWGHRRTQIAETTSPYDIKHASHPIC
jgi:hypothetical protein